MLEPYTKQGNCTNLQLKRRIRRAVEEELEKWERSGKKLEPWPETGSAGDA
jgi:hypothetical protein